jgi:hypothetical protein
LPFCGLDETPARPCTNKAQNLCRFNVIGITSTDAEVFFQLDGELRTNYPRQRY